MAFVHLHLHTEYSLLDGCNRVKSPVKGQPSPLVARVKEMGQTAVAMTDHGVMGGIIDFYDACKKLGVKPLLGCEVYVAQRTRFDKEAHKDSRPYHLTLIAKNRVGYSNLCRLVSLAYLEGRYYKPRVDHELLEKYGEGIICLTGCLRGEVNDALLNDDYALAKERLAFLKSVFHDDLFVELMNHGLPEQQKTNPLLLQLAREFDLLPVATNDAHYLYKEDAELQDIMICIATGKTLDDDKRLKMSTDEFYVKSEEEMLEAFSFCPEAVSNTQLVADRVEDDIIDFDTVYLPKFETQDHTSAEEFLRRLCDKGIKERFGDKWNEEYQKRLDTELEVIIGKGFPDYFLLVWDFINWAREHDIPVGPGRGSAAGSLVAYLIGITQLDPLPYDLLFERFLSPERTELPDIDTDFCTEGRGSVIDYCREKYGQDRVAQIATYGRMMAKNAIKDVARVMGISIQEANRITKAIPEGLKVTLKDAMEAPEFKAIYDSNDTYKKLIDTARRCEGMLRNTGIHACGVIISSEDLKSLVPLQLGPKDEVVVEYDMANSARVGMVKMDFLALRNLTVIEDCLKNIEHSHGQRLDMAKLTYGYSDPKVYKMLSDADTTGVFQLESAGMKRYLRQLQPDRFSDIVAFLALYRPGPINGGVVDKFIDARHGRGGGVKYPHPKLEPILKDTYGFFIYQEQVMLTACVLAGYTLAKADKLRKAMGKKKMDVMAEHRVIFTQGAVERGVDEATATEIFNTMEKFAEYGFNKSHSAAYAVVTYYTAYLKCYYRPEYMAALLTSVMTTIDKVSFFIEECRESGIEVLGPDINESRAEFTVVDGKILWGMAAVRNVGAQAVEYLVEEREQNGKFGNLADFIRRIDFRKFNKKVMEGLIKAGAFDKFGFTRSTLLMNLEHILEFGQSYRREQESSQMGLFDDGDGGLEISIDNVIKNYQAEFGQRVFLDFEKEMLGIYLSGSPLDAYREAFKGKCIANYEELKGCEVGGKVTIGGMITAVRTITTKSKQSMAFVQIEGLSGKTEVTVMPNVFSRFGTLCEEGSIVLVTGNLEISNYTSSRSAEEDDEELTVAEEEEEKSFQILADRLVSADTMLRSATAHSPKTPSENAASQIGLHIMIKSENVAQQINALGQVKTVLDNFKGANSVFMHVTSPGNSTLLRLGQSYSNDGDDKILQHIDSLLGKGSSWFVK